MSSSEPQAGRTLDRRAIEIFERCLGLLPAERERLLVEACRASPALRARVEALLREDACAEGGVAPAADPPESGAPPGRFGPYHALEVLGEGGMSRVYLAERRDGEFEQQVALKLVWGAHDGRAFERFRTERSILASLDHPYICRLLDAGTTADGVPYIAMERVWGDPITTYCDERRRNVRQRLELFCKVCDAVEHAHRSLIVHRDLKPGNILVTDREEPKLLDFGIARLLSPSGADEATTQVPAFTLSYASPEQVAAGGRSPITTATDVYSLGVVLYELVCGRLPFDLAGRRLADVVRTLENEIPRRPSTNLGESAPDSLPSRIAADRATSVSRLRRQLRGDLDCIVLQALRREPLRRYSSVQQLGDDLRRHLHGLPVLARGDELGYRLGRALKRHAAASAIAVMAVLFAAITGLQARNLAKQRDAARMEAERAETVTQLFVDSLEGVGFGSSVESAETITAANLLDGAARDIRSRLDTEPEVRATLLHTIGTAYRALGSYDASVEVLSESLAERRRLFGGRSEPVAESLDRLAWAYVSDGRFDDAEAAANEALAIRRSLLPPQDRRIAESLHTLGWTILRNSREEAARLAAAEARVREALRIRREGGASRALEMSDSLELLAHLLAKRGALREAEGAAREALAIQRRLGSPRSIASAANETAKVLRLRGDLDAALPLQRETLAKLRSALGRRHPDVAGAMNNLASLYLERREISPAEALFREALALYRDLLGDEHALVLNCLGNLAGVVREKGDLAAAEALQRDLRDGLRAAYGAGHPFVAYTTAMIAEVVANQGRAAEATVLVTEAQQLAAASLADEDWMLAAIESLHGAVLAAAGDATAGEERLRNGYRKLHEQKGEHFPETVQAHRRLVRLFEAAGRLAPDGKLEDAD